MLHKGKIIKTLPYTTQKLNSKQTEALNVKIKTFTFKIKSTII